MDVLNELTSNTPSRQIFHYTDAAGLAGMAREGAIWATSHLHLNDSTEHKIAVDLINEQVRMAKLSDKQRRTFELMLHSFREPIYITSFSENGNLLSQWRSYTGPGVGYSIGFAPNNLLFHSARSEAFNLVRCLYGVSKQRRLAKALVATFEEQYWNVNTPKDEVPAAVFHDFARQYNWHYAFTLFISACKHSSFSAEREWRLVCQHPDRLLKQKRVQYRPGRFGIVPYFPIPLNREQSKPRFDSIMIGPAANEEASLTALRILAETHLDTQHTDILGNRVPQITSSRIPYRP